MTVSHKNTRHGHWTNGKPSPTYKTWVGMKQRCTNPKYTDYEYYGGRGITVCSSWLTFENFLADMGSRPVGKTLDRIDNNKGYSVANCHWVDNIEQNRNRRSVKMTTEAIREVKIRYAQGDISQRALAKLYACSQTAINRALLSKEG